MIQTSNSTLTLEEWFVLNKEAFSFETIKETICKAMGKNPENLNKHVKNIGICDTRKMVFYYAHRLYPQNNLIDFNQIVNRHFSVIYRSVKQVEDFIGINDTLTLKYIEQIQFQFNNPTLTSHE